MKKVIKICLSISMALAFLFVKPAHAAGRTQTILETSTYTNALFTVKATYKINVVDFGGGMVQRTYAGRGTVTSCPSGYVCSIIYNDKGVGYTDTLDANKRLSITFYVDVKKNNVTYTAKFYEEYWLGDRVWAALTAHILHLQTICERLIFKI